MGGGDHALELGLELGWVHLVHALVLGRNDDVDAIGVVADMLVDPCQLDLELLGVKAMAPSTPMPPALDTAATTSRQWVKAKIGNSIPTVGEFRCS